MRPVIAFSGISDVEDILLNDIECFDSDLESDVDGRRAFQLGIVFLDLKGMYDSTFWEVMCVSGAKKSVLSLGTQD